MSQRMVFLERQVDHALHDCMFAFGQAVGDDKQLDYDAIKWLRDRYRAKFLHAMIVNGNSWEDDRDRVMAVGRYLGRRAVFHAGDRPSISRTAAAIAAEEIEAGCRMQRERQRASDTAASVRPSPSSSPGTGTSRLPPNVRLPDVVKFVDE